MDTQSDKLGDVGSVMITCIDTDWGDTTPSFIMQDLGPREPRNQDLEGKVSLRPFRPTHQGSHACIEPQAGLAEQRSIRPHKRPQTLSPRGHASPRPSPPPPLWGTPYLTPAVPPDRRACNVRRRTKRRQSFGRDPQDNRDPSDVSHNCRIMT